MADYDNNNTGVLFVNEKKENDKHPNFRGSAIIKTPSGEVLEMWVSAWVKTSKNGDEFMSLSYQPKDGSNVSGGNGGKFSQLASGKKSVDQSKPLVGVNDVMNDDIPF